jgi:phosphoenolpyruvate carboxylase
MDLSDAVHLLGDLLGQVISTEESPQLFATEETIRALSKARRADDAQAGVQLAVEVATLAPAAARGVAAAFALYFDLVNLAEEDYRVQALRQRQRELYPNPIGESIAEAIEQLKQRGVTNEQLAALLEQLHVELVLTAHPTEAKRRTVLSKLQRVSQDLRQLDDSDLLQHERTEVIDALRAEITALWLTDQARTSKPTVTDEVRTGLYFIGEIFWTMLPRIYADLDEALARHYPQLRSPARWLTLASWIGGDRDGNPNVTAEVTAETLRLHRGLAIEQHRKALQIVSRRFSLSARRVPPPPELKAWLEARHPLPDHVAFLETRYATEPYRLTLSLLSADLEYASQEQMAARLLENKPHTARIMLSDLTRPIDLIAAATPPALSHYPLHVVQQQLDIFGLHTAQLDIREDSTRLTSTLGEILRALNIDTTFEQSDDATRSRTLLRLLAEPAPHLAENPGITPETAETWATFRLMARTKQIYGQELLGPFIISMTHGPADMLTVLLLARWTGCADGLHIAPLFETLDDLAHAPRILAELFTLDVYRTHLARCHDEQTIMIGYSDSNKDGGYLAANWALYGAQENIAQVCREHSVKLTLFHGRGGSIARGGGPANRAIRAQPPGTVAGRFRMTEQGETITSRYANPDLAHRHLEQIVSAVLLASAPIDPAAIPAAWREAMDRLAHTAWRAYRSLVYDTPTFLDYWRSVTPIDEISRLRIGSRPTTRRGSALKLEYVRAIPWVFSWMQSRFNLPGWYGLGAALNEQPASLNREMYEQWPFFRALLDNAEMSLLKADMGIAALYSQLAPDQTEAQQIFNRVRAEYDRAVETVLDATHHAGLMDGDPIIQRSIHLRNPYVDPLNYIQVDMLRRLRALPDQNGAEAEALREVIVITINGIASGLRNTG